MSVHHHQARGTGRHAHPGSGLAVSASNSLVPPAPTPILKPTEVKRQFMLHADFQSYAKVVKKFMNGTVTKTEFHTELAKVLPTKEKRTCCWRRLPPENLPTALLLNWLCAQNAYE